jgi:membrane-bound serine protease (ClpP class)
MRMAIMAPGENAAWHRIRIVATALLALLLVSASPPAPRPAAQILHLEGAIGPATADFVTRGIADAARSRAPVVILQMDTPGGLDNSMRAIIQAILASPVPVATYVAPSGARAASAGAFILYASHIAAMAPGTNVGAATPVQIGGMPGMPGGEPDQGRDKGKDKSARPSNAMEAKAINDAVAYMRALAELRGRNVDWGESAVREAASVSAATALKEGVIDLEARSISELLRKMDGRTVTAGGRRIALATAGIAITEVRPDWRTRLLAAITNPNVALILMMIGVYGLLFEFMNPGAFLPGTVGAISLLLALYAFAALPVDYVGVALILLGLGMMASEAVLFSHGILGGGGVIAFAFGAAMLIDADVPEFRISWSVIAGVAIASGALILLIMRAALGARRRAVVSGAEQMLGAPAMVQDWSGRSGHVFVHGERWTAFSPAPLAPGQAVRVTRLDGLKLEVAGDAPPADREA